jgi:hypothetical protein
MSLDYSQQTTIREGRTSDVVSRYYSSNFDDFFSAKNRGWDMFVVSSCGIAD